MKPFQKRVLKLLLKVPKGKITTYKAVAQKLGTKAYRTVGNALNANKEPDKYPCFKVVNSDGRLGGYKGGIKEKIRRLKKEGIRVNGKEINNFTKIFFDFK